MTIMSYSDSGVSPRTNLYAAQEMLDWAHPVMVLDKFAETKPMTAYGKYALARATAREGDFENAAALAREAGFPRVWWRHLGEQGLLGLSFDLDGRGPRADWPTIARLSGGMARRVALARAIALDPMLAMYDEPFAGLDPISLNQIAELIRRLNDALGVTSIVVTYDMSESLKVVDYAYFLHHGQVVAQGTPEEVYASDNPFVHQFVHSEPDGPVAFHADAPDYRVDLGL